MQNSNHWRPGRAFALLMGQALMLAISAVLVLGSCAMLRIAQG
jgi:hypothetical protein